MQEKKKTPVGAIIAIVAFIVAIAAAAIVLLLVLPKDNNSDEKTEKNSSVEEKGEEKKPEPVVDNTNDNPGIIKPSVSNGNIGDHVRGKRDSSVLVVEYADPQCPGCAMMMPVMDEIYEEYKDKVAFVYRHFPIASHQNAVSAAIAIEAAGKQGYYWEMLSAMFDRRAEWIPKSGNSLTAAYMSIFKTVSNNKGNMEQFRSGLNNAELKTKVSFDKSKGYEDDLYATPTIIVNGEEVDIMSAENIKVAIEEKIDEALSK